MGTLTAVRLLLLAVLPARADADHPDAELVDWQAGDVRLLPLSREL